MPRLLVPQSPSCLAGLLLLLTAAGCAPAIPSNQSAQVSREAPDASPSKTGPAENVSSAVDQSSKPNQTDKSPVPSEVDSGLKPEASDTTASVDVRNKAAAAEAMAASHRPAAAADNSNTLENSNTPGPALTSESSPAPPSPSKLPHPPVFPPEALRRLLVFTPQGPLLLDLAIFIDGDPHTVALARLGDKLLVEADLDKDKSVEWSELFSSPAFRYGLYGNAPAGNEMMRRQNMEQYDSNANGKAETAELLRFISAANNEAGTSFTLTSAGFMASSEDVTDPLWTALDSDGDSALNEAEIAESSTRIQSFDSDNDELVSLGDFSTESQVSPPGMEEEPRDRRRGTRAVMRLHDMARRKELWAATLADAFPSFEGMKPEEVFPLNPDFFRTLDADSDMVISPSEALALETLPPHLVLRVDFNPKDSPSQDGQARTEGAVSNPQLLLAYISPELEAETSGRLEQEGFCAIRLKDFELECFVNDTAVGIDRMAEAKGRLMQLDANQDGYLSAEEAKRELAPDLQPFEALDVNRDEKIFADELAEFLGKRQALTFTQTKVKAGGRQGLLFNRLDQNRDARLSAREIASCPALLKSLDRDGDGTVVQENVTSGFSIAIARGNGSDGGLFVRQARVAPVDQATSKQAAATNPDSQWFEAMDLNKDGDISRREFLGTPEQFDKFDSSQDGFLTLKEAMAH